MPGSDVDGDTGGDVLLTVIVPVFNVEAYLERCLLSVLDQQLQAAELEVIVINDGTQDGSLAIAEAIASEHPNVIVLSQENQGLSAARNAGIARARGRYLQFVDGDDHVAADVLAGLVDTLHRGDLQVLTFGHRTLGPDENAPDEARHPPVPAQTSKTTSGVEYLATHHYLNNVWWYIVERELVLTLGLRFEIGRFVEDAVFTATLFSAADRVASVPVDVYRYVQRPGSIMRTVGTSHTTKLVADYERVVFGLQDLRQGMAEAGKVTPAYNARLVNRQQSFVFFLIARLARSSVPVRPTLPDALARLRTIQMYPMTSFPGADYPGPEYRLLTLIFDRGYLLYPFIRVLRGAIGVQAWWTTRWSRRRLRGPLR